MPRKLFFNAAAGARGVAYMEDGKHTSGGMMVAVNKSVASMVDTAGGKVESVEGNEGKTC